MNNIYLSKSKYCKAIRCKKILWMDKYKSEEKNEADKDAIFENGKKVGEYAKRLFGEYIDIEYDSDLSKMIIKTQEALETKPSIITEASFVYNKNFCSVDILKNEIDGIEIYEVKSSTSITDIYLEDASYQYYILTSLGYQVKKVCIVYINKEYYRHGELEINKLFNIEDVTDIAINKKNDIEEQIKEINKYMEKNNKDEEPDETIGVKCIRPYGCDYWGYCTKDLPRPNIFDIGGGMRLDKKFEKYYEGLSSFEDLQNLDINEKAREQIDFEINNREPKIEIEPVREFIDSLKYPLYFIDFETFQLTIPEYEGTKPYQQLPFQYSLHIINEKGGQVQHKEFLAEADDKNFLRNFAETMIKDLPDNGSVIVYNKGFECSRIKELSKLFPDLKKDLMRINNNIVDMYPIFRKRNIYLKEMQGSASIKKVLPALYPDDPELNYSNLPLVHHGNEASETFLNLKKYSKEEQEKMRKGLLLYCELDTYAMVKIWEKLIEIIEE